MRQLTRLMIKNFSLSSRIQNRRVGLPLVYPRYVLYHATHASPFSPQSSSLRRSSDGVPCHMTAYHMILQRGKCLGSPGSDCPVAARSFKFRCRATSPGPAISRSCVSSGKLLRSPHACMSSAVKTRVSRTPHSALHSPIGQRKEGTNERTNEQIPASWTADAHRSSQIRVA